jgi:hypothetical protein
LIDILTCDDDINSEDRGDAEESESAAQMGDTGSEGGKAFAKTVTTSGEFEQLMPVYGRRE